MPNAKRVRVISAAFILIVTIVAASADYVVQRGDTVGKIAKQFGVPAKDIAAVNSLSNPDLIFIGQVLIIPGQTPAEVTTQHVVALGETLGQIASRYGVTTKALVDANAISNPNLIRIGQQLSIPSSTPVTAPPASEGTPAAPAPVATHTVLAGETLAGIAAQHGTTVEALAAANGITDTSTIYIGTALRLSGEGFVAPPSTPSPMIYTVAPGDILANVASQYGTTIDQLVTTNGISNPNLITVGQQLQVPITTPGWVCPVAGGRYFNDWGFPRSGGRLHEGNDLFAPRGTPVVAPVAGTVVFQNGRIGGLQFRLYAEDGTTYIGSHLDTTGVDGHVNAGGQLGTVGDSGNAIGSKTHLHFEMHPSDGPAVNPYPTLQKYGC